MHASLGSNYPKFSVKFWEGGQSELTDPALRHSHPNFFGKLYLHKKRYMQEQIICVIKLQNILLFVNIFSIICLHFELTLKQFWISSFFESGWNTISKTSTGKFSMLYFMYVFRTYVENTMNNDAPLLDHRWAWGDI